MILSTHGILAGVGAFPNLWSYHADGVTENLSLGTTSSHKWMHGADNTTGFQFTISFWVKLANPNSDSNGGLFATCFRTILDTGVVLYYDDRSSQGLTRAIRLLIVRGVSGTTVINAIWDVAFPDSTGWHQILLTYNQGLASGNAELFIDTVSQGTKNKSGSTPSTGNSSDAPKFMSEGDNTNYLEGKLYHQIICNKALSSAERTEVFNLSGGDVRETSFAANVFSAYHFPGGQADYPTQTDYVGSYDATMVNGIATDINSDIPV